LARNHPNRDLNCWSMLAKHQADQGLSSSADTPAETKVCDAFEQGGPNVFVFQDECDPTQYCEKYGMQELATGHAATSVVRLAVSVSFGGF
jgi:hypothetical protein